MAISQLKKQHEELISLASQIRASSLKLGAESDKLATDIHAHLTRFTQILSLHLEEEDGKLYPGLIACDRLGTSEVAKRFFHEMGDLGPCYGAFSKRWSTSEKIRAGATQFASEAQAVFAKLSERIRREELILYPLAKIAIPETGLSA